MWFRHAGAAGQPTTVRRRAAALAVAQVLLGVDGRSTTGCGCATARLGHLFRYLPKQPGYHKRLKAAAPLLAAGDALIWPGRCPSWYDQVRLVDATPVPCGTSRETVQALRSGRVVPATATARRTRRCYWGLKLYLLTTPDGMPIAWCLADPKIGEREVAADLLATRSRPARCGPG